MKPIIRSLLSGALAIFGCTSIPESELPVITAGLPVISEIPLDYLPNDALRGLGAQVVVSPTGLLAMFPPSRPDDDRVILITDSTGTELARFARRGKGPGELTLHTFAAFVNDTVFAVWDMTTSRTTRFGLSGSVLSELKSDPFASPMGALGDSLDFRMLSTDGGSEWQRISLLSGNGRVIIGQSDSAFNAAFPDRGTPNRPVLSARSYAAGAGRVVLGDGRGYQLLFYREDGRFIGTVARKLPPRFPGPWRVQLESLALEPQPFSRAQKSRVLEQIKSRPLDHFARLRFDDRGRLWVLGLDGDSAFADIYSDTVALGRLAVPCVGFMEHGWDLSGRWLATVCRDSREESISGAVVKLFRIEG